MTYKQIEASREVRLWLKDVIVPVAGFVTCLMWNKATREPIIKAFRDGKESIKNKFKKD